MTSELTRLTEVRNVGRGTTSAGIDSSTPLHADCVGLLSARRVANQREHRQKPAR